MPAARNLGRVPCAAGGGDLEAIIVALASHPLAGQAHQAGAVLQAVRATGRPA